MEDKVKKHKILVVDDEPINIFLLEGILTEEGFEVFVAQNGEEALLKITQEQPDAILLDIMMPGMSGMEVLEKVMENPLTCHIPVVMVTAKSEAEDVQLALNKGALEYIKKPINEIEMLARLQTVLRLKQQEDLLRDQLQSKERFIHMLSHDMRAPLLSVAGLAEILLKDEQNTEHLKILNTIINSSNFIVDYFNKLLSWSNLKAKELVLNKTWFSLSDVFEASRVIYSLQIEGKKQKLIIECEPDLQICADISYFQQIINNLLSNAIKYTPDGGAITLQAKKELNYTIIKVCDTGMGMPEIAPEELFGSAFHKSVRGTKGEKGTGVGLRICKIIADAHGFDINYKSGSGKGTEFIITAPVG